MDNTKLEYGGPGSQFLSSSPFIIVSKMKAEIIE